MELILDLVANVEDGQHLAVANVAPPKSTLTGLTNQRALQLQAKQQQLQAAPLSHPSNVLRSMRAFAGLAYLLDAALPSVTGQCSTACWLHREACMLMHGAVGTCPNRTRLRG